RGRRRVGPRTRGAHVRTGAKVGIDVGAAVVVVGAAAAISGPGLYADRANSVAAQAPALEQPAAALPDPDAVAGTWTVGEGSFAGCRVEERLQGNDVTVTGRTEYVTGLVTVAGGAISAAPVEVDVVIGATHVPPRDVYFCDRAMVVRDFPTAA